MPDQMPDQIDVMCAAATNAIRRRMQDFQADIGNPVTPLPIRLPDGSDVWETPTSLEDLWA